jgi:hypothetical protein
MVEKLCMVKESYVDNDINIVLFYGLVALV